MGKDYSLPRKIERILRDDHGVTATVSEDSSGAGLLVISGDFEERIDGAINRQKLADLAQRIKASS